MTPDTEDFDFDIEMEGLELRARSGRLSEDASKQMLSIIESVYQHMAQGACQAAVSLAYQLGRLAAATDPKKQTDKAAVAQTKRQMDAIIVNDSFYRLVKIYAPDFPQLQHTNAYSICTIIAEEVLGYKADPKGFMSSKQNLYKESSFGRPEYCLKVLADASDGTVDLVGAYHDRMARLIKSIKLGKWSM